MIRSVSAILVVSLFCYSCFEQAAGKPAAIGAAGRINIIIPEQLRNGPIGQALDSIFTAELQVFPRDERLFTIHFVNPSEINRSQKNIRNIIFVFTFDDKSSEAGRIKSIIEPESLRALQSDSSFVHTATDVFARGQEIMYLYGPDAKTLLSRILKNGKRLTGHFNEKEGGRLRKGLLASSANRDLASSLTKKYGFKIKIPFGYQLADQQPDFVWLRQINPADDRDVWIARKKFTNQKDFEKDRLVAFRNEVCRKYLFEDPDRPDTYLVTEERISFKPVLTRTVNFNGLYAVEMRGLWKTNIPSMGGPFMGYAMVDEANGYFYYIEGFTFSPSRPQREIMREVEVILGTFAPVAPGSDKASDNKGKEG